MFDVSAIAAAMLAGLVGSGHCFAMCGGLSGALGLRVARNGNSAVARVATSSFYQLGRIGSYTIAGGIAGTLGAGLHSFAHAPSLAAALRVGSGFLIVLIALRMGLGWNTLGWLERAGGQLWSRIRPLALRQASSDAPSQALTLGMLWGWMPCGLVYSMLLVAALSRSPAEGALIMLAYGLGTLPAMMATMLSATTLHQLFRRRDWQRACAALLALSGVWTIATAAAAKNAIAGLYCL